MAEQANVHSIEAIKEFRAALCRFGEDTKNALGAVDMEVRRTLDWLLHDRPMHWQNEIKRCKEDLSQANAEVFRRRLQAKPGYAVQDTEQKELARHAQRRLNEAEHKLEVVKKWGPQLQHAVEEYRGRARPMSDMIEQDLTQALALLDRMTDALDAYISLAPPPITQHDEAASAVAGAGSGSSPGTLTSAAVAQAEPAAPKAAGAGEAASTEAAADSPEGQAPAAEAVPRESAG